MLESPPYDAVSVTLPAVFPDIVTEQVPVVSDFGARVHVVELRVTAPVPVWDQVTVPVGE